MRRPPAVDAMTTVFLLSHVFHETSVHHLLGIPEKQLLVIDIILGCICMFGNNRRSYPAPTKKTSTAPCVNHIRRLIGSATNVEKVDDLTELTIPKNNLSTEAYVTLLVKIEQK